MTQENFIAIEHIEALAWADLYAATPRLYAQQNGIHYRHFDDGVGIAHATLTTPTFARIFAITEDSDLLAAIGWMDAQGLTGWVAQIPETPEASHLRTLLEERGYGRKGPGWAKFHRTNATIDEGFLSQLHCRAISGDGASEFAEVIASGFGFPDSIGAWLANIVDRPNWKVFLAYAGGSAVACGAIYIKDGLAWLGIDATVPNFRGQGAQSQLIRARLRYGIECGVRHFTAETGQPEKGLEAQHKSYSNYRRAGFTQTYTRLHLGKVD